MLTEQYKLSIIIPIYNTKQYLGRCLDSILSQIDHRTEVILIDDGSTDGSGEVCETYAKKNINIKVIHQENRGVSVARNVGIDLSIGEWITFVDSDDILDKDYYKNISKYWDLDVDFLMFNTLKLDASNQIIRDKKIEDLMVFERNDPGKMIRDSFLGKTESIGEGYNSYRGPVGKLFRRSLIEKTNLRFDENVKIGEDMLFMLKLYDNFSMAKYIPVVNYIYWHNGSSSTNRYKPEYEEIVATYVKAITPWLEEHPEYEIYHMNYRLNDIILYLKFDFFHKENSETDSEKRKRMKRIFSNYHIYYEKAKKSGLIKKYGIGKRMIFWLAIRKAYFPLKLICRIRFQNNKK